MQTQIRTEHSWKTRGEYEFHPFTQEQRRRLKIEKYYRPFSVEAGQAPAKPVFSMVKRGMDIVFSIACLVAISPLILLMMLLIVIDDPKGGPLYQQERIGKNGKNFQMYKLRSMIVNADDQLEQLAQRNEFHGKAFKMKRDPRITRIGRFIRKTSIDELMQLINVLKGDMSFVGPRPPLPDEAGQYDEYEKQRLLVTPGMTCFWQIQPNRHEMDFEDWVALDLRYIMERNLWMDLQMILRTVWVVAKSFLPCSHSR